MREKLFAFGDDSWIEDESGERVYRVDGKALRMRKTLKLEDLDGNELCKIQERKLRVRDTMEIEAPDGTPSRADPEGDDHPAARALRGRGARTSRS